MATMDRSGERRAFGPYVLGPLRVGGLVGGLLLFLAWLEPTEWPRGWIGQASSTAILTSVGYGIGSLVGAGIRGLWKLIGFPVLSDRARRWVPVGATIVVVVLGVGAWQLARMELRDVVGMSRPSYLGGLATLGVAAILTVLFVLVGRAFGWAVYRSDGLLFGRLPAWAAHIATATLVVALFVLGSVGVYLSNRRIINGPTLAATAEELSLTGNLTTARGWSSTELDKALRWADQAGATSVVILDDGQVVAEWGNTSLVSDVHSVRKSIVSVLYGIAIERGLIDPSATLALLGFDDAPPLTDQERQATIEDIVTSRSGIYHSSVMDDDKDGRPERGSHRPGQHFYYNNWSHNAAGGIFEELTGITLGDAFLEWVAEPIGMEDFHEGDVIYAGSPESRFPAYRFRMSTRDLARFGLLMELDGRWEGQPIVPAAWIAESTTPHATVRDAIGYAHLWWTDGPAFFASGTGGQRIYVDPTADLVIVVKVNTGQGLARVLWVNYGPNIPYGQFTELRALINSAAPQ